MDSTIEGEKVGKRCARNLLPPCAEVSHAVNVYSAIEKGA